MQAARRGTLLIADITGYSTYLNESELAHAEQTLSALLELLVDQTRPPMVVSKLEGDAVFSYGFEEAALHGQAFVESLEACYVEFRRAMELMVLNTTCTCNACANISTLDLKFFVHHGEFIVGEAAGRSELHGPDVNLLHRILKNTVSEQTGFRAYVFYTQEAVRALGLDDLVGSWTQHTDAYPDVGEVVAWVEDLSAAWERAKSAPTVEFAAEDVALEMSTFIALPREIVWSYLIDPAYRRLTVGSDRIDRVGEDRERVDQGTAFICYHGTRETRQVVVEWRPLERIVTRDAMRFLGAPVVIPVEYTLEPVEGGTRVTQRARNPEGAFGVRQVMRVGFPRMQKQFQSDVDDFRDAIERDAATRLEPAPPSA